MCVCVFGRQSSQTSTLLCCIRTHCSVSSSYCVSLSVYQVWGSAGCCAACLLSLNPVYALLNLTSVRSHTHTHVIFSLLFGVFQHPISVRMQQEACGNHVIWPTCKPYRKLMVDFSVFPASGGSFLSVKQHTSRNIMTKSLNFKRRSRQL